VYVFCDLFISLIKNFPGKLTPKNLYYKKFSHMKNSLEDGTIRTRSNGTKWIKKDNKWVYLKKPKENKIKYPSCKLPPYIPPPPDGVNLFPTKFDGYYVTPEGEVWTEWHTNPSRRGNPRKLNQFLRGGNEQNGRYLAVNISLKDENEKYLKQIKYSAHRLIAETLIPNPYNYPEIDHIDRNKQNNSIDNLRWTNRIENMSFKGKPFKITDTKTGMIYEGVNLAQWMKENWEWISKRTKTLNPEKLSKTLRTDNRCCGFILER
jgi:hypothetical protein